jgi:hypothetical protein
MKPATPVIPRRDLPSMFFRGTGYEDMPAIRLEGGDVVTRWELRWWERIKVLLTGDVYLWIKTFNQPLQPIWMQVDPPALKLANRTDKPEPSLKTEGEPSLKTEGWSTI